MLAPETPAELAETLRAAAARGDTITLAGNSSKRLMAGPVEPAALTVTTAYMRRVLEYEPYDLTVSVEAGLPWCELVGLLERNRQMVPLDPPFRETATVGGVIASNSSGPRRQHSTVPRRLSGQLMLRRYGQLTRRGLGCEVLTLPNFPSLKNRELQRGPFGKPNDPR